MSENMSGIVGQAAHTERRRRGNGNKEAVMFLNRVKLTTVIAVLAALCMAVPLVGASGDFSSKDQATDATKIGQGWCDAWNSADVNLFPAAFTDDFFYEEVPTGFTSHGTTDVWEYDRTYFAAIPDFHFACTATFLNDGHGSVEWVATGTDVGLYKTGKQFSVRGASVIDVRDGKIARSIDYYDNATLLKQIGLLPDLG